MIKANEALIPLAGTTCHNLVCIAAIFNPPASVTPAQQEGVLEPPAALPLAHCPHSQKHDRMSASNKSSGKSKILG